jgi:tyrosine-protein phosphatase SIW14
LNLFKFLYLSLILPFIGCTANSISESKRDILWAKELKNSTLDNLYKITDSLYRSEQPTQKEFAYLKAIGIKSVLNLRATHSDTNLTQQLTLKDYSVQITTSNFSDKEIIEALKIIKYAPKPLLVHCKHGSDRTGVVIAMYRIVFQNWSKEKALDELLNGGYGFHIQYHNIPTYIKNVAIDEIKKHL